MYMPAEESLDRKVEESLDRKAEGDSNGMGSKLPAFHVHASGRRGRAHDSNMTELVCCTS